MDEIHDSKKRGWSVAAYVTLAVLLLPSLYVLSAGPAYRLAYGDGLMSRECFTTIYWPVLRLTDSGWEPLSDWVTDYLF